MKKVCFVSFADSNFSQIRKTYQTPFHDVYKDVFDVYNFSDYTSIKSPTHLENPYFFKPLSILKVKEMGYEVVIWLDSPFSIFNLDDYLIEIKKHGVYLGSDGWFIGQWANDKSLEYFKLSRDEAMKINNTRAGIIAFDFTNPIANEFLTKWIESGKNGIFKGSWNNNKFSESQDIRCLGHRHDQTCAEIIAYQMNFPVMPSAENKFVLSRRKNVANYKNISGCAYSTSSTCQNSLDMAQITKNVQGAIVECGIAAGSNLALMMIGSEFKKKYYGFDSFEGIQLGNVKDEQQPGIGAFLHDPTLPEDQLLKTSGITKYSLEQVTRNFKRWNLDMKNLKLIKGWVQHTLEEPIIKEIDKISILRLDMDMYSPTLFALEKLFPLIEKRGVLIMDDYALPGCRKACDEYFNKINIELKFIQIYGGQGPVYAII